MLPCRNRNPHVITSRKRKENRSVRDARQFSNGIRQIADGVERSWGKGPDGSDLHVAARDWESGGPVHRLDGGAYGVCRASCSITAIRFFT